MAVGARARAPGSCRASSTGSSRPSEPAAAARSPPGVLLGGAFLGQAIGLARRRAGSGSPSPRAAARPSTAPAGRWSRRRSACSSPSGCCCRRMADVPGLAGASRPAARRSPGAVDRRRCPPPPDTLAALRRLVGDDRFPQVFDALRPGARRSGRRRRRPGIPPSVADRGRAVDGEGRGRGLRPHPGGQRLRRRRRPRRHQRPRRRRRRARPRCSRDRRSAGSTPRSSPSTPTATSPCCRRPASTGRRCRWATAEPGDRGGVFGHPGGGPLAHRRRSRSPSEVRRRRAATSTTSDRDRARRAHPGRRPARPATRARPSSTRPAPSSAWPSPSPPTGPASPTPSPTAEARAPSWTRAPARAARDPGPSTPARCLGRAPVSGLAAHSKLASRDAPLAIRASATSAPAIPPGGADRRDEDGTRYFVPVPWRRESLDVRPDRARSPTQQSSDSSRLRQPHSVHRPGEAARRDRGPGRRRVQDARGLAGRRARRGRRTRSSPGRPVAKRPRSP